MNGKSYEMRWKKKNMYMSLEMPGFGGFGVPGPGVEDPLNGPLFCWRRRHDCFFFLLFNVVMRNDYVCVCCVIFLSGS